MADDTKTSSPDPVGQKDAVPSPQGLVFKALTATVTGIGVLGFVAFFGGALLWLRADKAELPANEAVSIIPNGVLVTTGAQFLVPAVLIAAGVLAVVSAVYLRFRLPKERRAGKMREDAAAARAKAVEEAAKAEARRGQAGAAARALARQAELMGEMPDELAAIGSMREAAEGLGGEAQRLGEEAQEAETALARENALAKRLDREAEAELERDPGHFAIELALGALALLLIPPIANGAIWRVGPLLGLLLGVIAAVCAVAAVFVYRETRKFVWFGIVAFLAAGTYIGIATYVNTNKNPKFEAVAALRTGHEPLTGVFIAETKEELYLGSFREPDQPPRLIAVLRSQVSELAVSPLLDPDAARRRAIAMALEECDQQVEIPKTETEVAQVKPACTAEQRAELRRRAG